MKILMLLTDAFGGFGGIAKFNRDFLKGLDASPLVKRVFVWPRLIPEPIDEPLPTSIVYERGFANGKLAYLSRAIAGMIFHPHIDLVVCGHINLLPLAWAVAKVRRGPVVLIIHGIEAWRPTKNPLTNTLAGAVDSLISVSKVSADRFRSWSKLPEDRVFILPNCVDPERFTPGPKSPELVSRYKLENARVLMTLGRLESEERYKGFDEVLEALPDLSERFPNIKYLIVGDGPDKARLEVKATLLGVADRVIFTGRIEESEKVDIYRLADAYVMPSSGEGFGIVLIEAAACGIPVIGSRTDGSSEALLEGRLGRLVDPKDPAELIDAIVAALAKTGRSARSYLLAERSCDKFLVRVASWLKRFMSQ